MCKSAAQITGRKVSFAQGGNERSDYSSVCAGLAPRYGSTAGYQEFSTYGINALTLKLT